MIATFKKLHPDEIRLMKEVPALVTILVAGADENIEKKEMDWAAKITRFRKVTSKIPSLQDYYAEIDKDFQATLSRLLKTLPANTHERNAVISDELTKLNAILPKLSSEFATHFYQDLKSFAESIAKSAGGMMGMGSVSHEEEKWVWLEMIMQPH
jgi:hypothetical protein